MPVQAEAHRARPRPALRAAVRGYCGYREYSAGPLRRREVPHGQVTLIVSFGDPITLHTAGGTVTHRSFLAGLHDRHVITDFTGGQHGVQVDLSPLGAFGVVGGATRELANGSAGLDGLPLPGLAELPDRLAEVGGWPGRFALLDELLVAWTRHGPVADAEVGWAWRRLARSGGRLPVGALAREVGWSRRHLGVRFRDQVGLAPKAAARVLRFRHAAALLRRVADGTISDVAAASGYADQAHLAREFAALAGCTPTQFRADR